MKKLKVNEKAKKIINICCIVCISLLVLFSSFIMVFAGVGACTNTAKADDVQSVSIFRGNNQFTPTCNFYKNSGVMSPSNNSGEFWLSTDYIIRMVPCTEIFDEYMVQFLPNYMPMLGVSSYFSRYTKGTLKYFYLASSDSRNVYCDTFTDVFQNSTQDYYMFNSVRLHLTENGPDLSQPIQSAFYYGEVPSGAYSGGYSCIDYLFDFSFNCNVQRVVFSSNYYDYSNLGYPTFKNSLTLYDNNDNTFTINFTSRYFSNITSPLFSLWETRTYYLNNSFTDNQYYQNGFNDGEQYGRLQSQLNNSEQLQAEYNRGKDDGISIGKNLGYQEALDGNLTAGSFFANMLSILDVPLFGFISLGQILMLGVSVSLVMIALKLFAGG